MKSILDAIAMDESRKKSLIRGDAVDKAEQLSESTICCCVANNMHCPAEQVRLIQEKLDAFKESLANQQKRRTVG